MFSSDQCFREQFKIRQQVWTQIFTTGPQPGNNAAGDYISQHAPLLSNRCSCVQVSAAVQGEPVFGTVEAAVTSCFNEVRTKHTWLQVIGARHNDVLTFPVHRY